MTNQEVLLPLSGLDPNGNLKFGAILEAFQEVADHDAFASGTSVRQIIDQGLTWVLHKYRIEIKRYPSSQDGKIQVKTWTEPYGRLYCLRNFELRSASGELLGTAYSWWVLLDFEKQRPVRIDKREDIYSKMGPAAEPQPQITKLPSLTEPSLTEEIKVRWKELDVNHHTNHIAYFDWALDTVPDEVLYDMLPVCAECEYINSVKKTRVRVESEEIPSEDGTRVFLHSVVSLEDGKVSAKLRSVWKKR